tara:strand:- start:1625 stop:1864 length:240 start_codon:yes stop_codon:yes gene_type:complete
MIVTETLFAVLLILNGNLIESVPTDGMADCLKTKRTAMQNIGPDQEGVYMKCLLVEADTEIYMGRKRIKKIYTEDVVGD